MLVEFCQEGSRGQKESPCHHHENTVHKMDLSQGQSGLGGGIALYDNVLQNRTRLLIVFDVLDAQQGHTGTLSITEIGRRVDHLCDGNCWWDGQVFVQTCNGGSHGRTKAIDMGVQPVVVGITIGTASNRFGQSNDLFLGGIVELPASFVKGRIPGGVQQNLKRTRDTRVDVDQTMDRVLFRTNEGLDAWIVKEGSSVDAEKVHDKTLCANGVTYR
mmetsp:Transcript_16885/g.42190  ORF Transcript_16885/g.42190 Transcript_16885/m.42190 type:complete len:216 (-) Transcript_16885:389-1036(-)